MYLKINLSINDNDYKKITGQEIVQVSKDDYLLEMDKQLQKMQEYFKDKGWSAKIVWNYHDFGQYGELEVYREVKVKDEDIDYYGDGEKFEDYDIDNYEFVGNLDDYIAGVNDDDCWTELRF